VNVVNGLDLSFEMALSDFFESFAFPAQTRIARTGAATVSRIPGDDTVQML
jgi:hypothetical protein